MGEVDQARHTRLDRYVEIKVFPDQLSADPERCARFKREALSGRTADGASAPTRVLKPVIPSLVQHHGQRRAA